MEPVPSSASRPRSSAQASGSYRQSTTVRSVSRHRPSSGTPSSTGPAPPSSHATRTAGGCAATGPHGSAASTRSWGSRQLTRRARDGVRETGGAAAPCGAILAVAALSRSAYRSELSDCSVARAAGDRCTSMAVRESAAVKESRRMCVSLDPRNGTCELPMSSARMHSLRQSNERLMSAPSVRDWRLASSVSAARSEPARSTSVSLPCSAPDARSRRKSCISACERDERW
mmetsp:Transcript_14688/g.48020  ORF Transcript_14688/g.48020 Transcript_14688/m.48020 type:complete len:230 (+) Transcript_14688:562-1251(+)